MSLVLPVPTEHQEQAALIEWWSYACKRYQLPERLLLAIPNGGLRSKAAGGKLKAEGVRPGIPDLFLAVVAGPYSGMFLEMKRAKGSKTSGDQAAAIIELRAQTYRVEVCLGYDRARAAIEDYLRYL